MPDQNSRKDVQGENELNAAGSNLPSEAKQPRRKRYARSHVDFASFTPVRVEILRFLAELRFLSLPQIAKLCCPSSRQDLSEKSARRQMRMLFDAGLVDVLPVARAAITQLDSPNDTSLLYGSAPNIYTLTPAGLDALGQAGLCDKPQKKRAKPSYGPKNSLFLAHELAVRDVRVWLERAANASGHEIEQWKCGEEAAIYLDTAQTLSPVRPDAWFVYRLGQIVLVGLVEVDRGTERGDRRWREKLEAYRALYARVDLKSITGYQNARVLVFCISERRRDQVSAIIESYERSLSSRFWITDLTTLEQPSLLTAQWRQSDDPVLKSMIGG